MFSCFGFRARHKGLTSAAYSDGELRAPLTPKDGVPLNHHNHHLKQTLYGNHQHFYNNSNRNSFNSTRRNSQASNASGESTAGNGKSNDDRNEIGSIPEGLKITDIDLNTTDIVQSSNGTIQDIKQDKNKVKKSKKNSKSKKKSNSLPRNINVEKLKESNNESEIDVNNEKNKKLTAMHNNNNGSLPPLVKATESLVDDVFNLKPEELQNEKSIYKSTALKDTSIVVSSKTKLLNRSLSPTDLDSFLAQTRTSSSSNISTSHLSHDITEIQNSIVTNSANSVISATNTTTIPYEDESSIPFIDSSFPSDEGPDLIPVISCNTKSFIPKMKYSSIQSNSKHSPGNTNTNGCIHMNSENLIKIDNNRKIHSIEKEIKKDTDISTNDHEDKSKVPSKKISGKSNKKALSKSRKTAPPLSYTRLPISQDRKPFSSTEMNSGNDISPVIMEKDIKLQNVINTINYNSTPKNVSQMNDLNKSITSLNVSPIPLIEKSSDALNVSQKMLKYSSDIYGSSNPSINENSSSASIKPHLNGTLNESFEMEAHIDLPTTNEAIKSQLSPLHREAFRKKKRKSSESEQDDRKYTVIRSGL